MWRQPVGSSPEPGRASAGGPLRFEVLGAVRAWHGGRELALGAPQQRAVLAMLLMRCDQLVAVDELVDGLWGPTPPAQPRTTLRSHISRLRRALVVPNTLVRESDGYLLRVPRQAVDLAAQEARLAEAAAAAAAGDVAGAARIGRQVLDQWPAHGLAGIPGPFAEATRARLAEQRLRAAEQTLDWQLQTGGHEEAAIELAGLVAAHPMRERLAELLMLAAYRCGRQAEALSVYTDTRRVLDEELGIEPGPGLREMHRRVLRADPLLLASPAPVDPRGTAARPSPTHLPEDTADFTGRAATLAHLRDALRGPRPLVAITGMGGIGKTALAVRLAHQVRERYPDGQLHVDLRGTDRQPADPGEVAADLLGALGVAPAAIPASSTERVELLRSVTADRHVLLVLDNAAGAAQIRPLLPTGPHCAVLVTSRHTLPELSWLTGWSVTRSPLTTVNTGEALAMLTAILGEARVSAEADAAVDLAAACGHLPLAIRIIGARLATRPTWSLSAMTTRLADQDRRLTELRAGDLTIRDCFAASHEQLDPELSRAFRLLAVPTWSGFCVGSATAVLDRPPATAEELVEDLVDRGLLDSPQSGWYRYHDLMWLFAHTHPHTTPEERAATHTRLTAAHLATVHHLHATA
ncbi:AfsR/SARP family transcriptional regulator [Streptoalloteichus hindustanus]|uniref:DNA-binding transcriptional activator of the SARP family n=1 Tax=Streptoalloteichus hindustanus TaxID=2017 RepID=A0A1M5PX68_STRHI|nr:BTAD domain-containing putative transcriptional regulator [Streptoalloteichus hindustanus]SHH06069.1 DNA-binding transcriptional activator of the SARP family [Streptoalloteichus hindustanus]